MRRSALLGLTAFAAAALTGCRTANKAPKTLFEQFQERASAISEAGGVAAVGIGSSKETRLALEKARIMGRAELARIVEVKVSNLQKDFAEEIGSGENAEINALFSTATKTIASNIMHGSVPKDLKYEPKAPLVEAVALMVLDPKAIADAFAAQQSSAQALYNRFRGSQAFKELDEEIRKFEEFKKQDAGSAPGGE